MTRPRAPSAFRQRDLTRAVKGAIAGGVRIERIVIDKEGRIEIIAQSTEQNGQGRETNEWDTIS
jgi:hypothetical protein